MTNPEAVEALVEAVKRLRFNANFQRGYGDDRFSMRRYDADLILAALSSAPVAATHVLDESGLVCSCHARFSTRWEAAEHAGLTDGGPLSTLSHASPVDEGMVMVPREPTEAMIIAGAMANAPNIVDVPDDSPEAEVEMRDHCLLEARQCWSAMLAASTPKDTGERGGISSTAEEKSNG